MTDSRAPLAKIEDYNRRKGWAFPWYSSQGGDFHYNYWSLGEAEIPAGAADGAARYELLPARW